MGEKIKKLIDKKILILIGVIVIGVAAIVILSSQDNDKKTESVSNKKQMLENYAKEGETEEETTINLNDYTVHTVFDKNAEEVECLIKATIDYAMTSETVMSSGDIYSYWKGVQIGVSRMHNLDSYKDKITLIKDGKVEWYQVDEVLAEEIGHAMSGMGAPEWIEGDGEHTFFVEYDLTTKSYLFRKFDTPDYYIVYDYEVIEEGAMETTGVVHVTTSLSEQYPSAYAVKDYKIQFDFPAYNAFGISISAVSEFNSETRVSEFEKSCWDIESNVETALDADLFLENAAMPYVKFRMEYEDKNEAMWLAIYNALYNYLERQYGEKTDYFMLFPSRKTAEAGDTEYMVVDQLYIKELIAVYTKEMLFEVDLSTMPDYLRELVTYDEAGEVYEIEIKDEYIREFDCEYAAREIDEGKYRVYGAINSGEEEKLFSFVLNGNGLGNFNVAMEDLKF